LSGGNGPPKLALGSSHGGGSWLDLSFFFYQNVWYIIKKEALAGDFHDGMLDVKELILLLLLS
jgi:hypothetical protein